MENAELQVAARDFDQRRVREDFINRMVEDETRFIHESDYLGQNIDAISFTDQVGEIAKACAGDDIEAMRRIRKAIDDAIEEVSLEKAERAWDRDQY